MVVRCGKNEAGEGDGVLMGWRRQINFKSNVWKEGEREEGVSIAVSEGHSEQKQRGEVRPPDRAGLVNLNNKEASAAGTE